jgi:hypothetical protein
MAVAPRMHRYSLKPCELQGALMNIILINGFTIDANFLESILERPDVSIYLPSSKEDALRMISAVGPEILIMEKPESPLDGGSES